MELMMEDWKRGLVTLVTSTLTISEVLFVRVDSRVDHSRDKDIDALFDPPPPRKLLTVELSRYTAFRARGLARAMSLSWEDAIHVASALEAHCPVFHTTDDALWQKSGLVGGSPTLKIEAPSWIKQTEAVDKIEPGSFTNLVEPNEPEQPV
jgi:predicted nucleic acid-binding protein